MFKGRIEFNWISDVRSKLNQKKNDYVYKKFIIEMYYYNRYESDYDSVNEDIIEDHIIDPTEDVDEYIYIYTHLRLITELQLNIYTYIPISNSS